MLKSPSGILWVGVNAVTREGLTADRRLSCGGGLRGILRILCRELRSRVRDPAAQPPVSRTSRVSALQIEFAMQIHKNREHVSRFLYFWREKVSTIRRNFRTTLERPTVRSPLSAKL